MSECSRCGQCCMTLPLGDARNLDQDLKHYLLTRGCIIEHGKVIVPFPCPHLTLTLDTLMDGKRVYSCDIHDHKPKVCKEFIGRPIAYGRKYYVPDSCTMRKRGK